MPAISIIIPVFNSSKTLKRCIDSIIAQTFTSWEVVMVDDGSMDGSLEIAATYEQNAKIRIITTSHQGAWNARNEGLNVARGNYVCFVDSDDFLAPDYLCKLYEKRHYDCVICGYYVDAYSSGGDLLERVEFLPVELEKTDFSDKGDLYELFASGMVHINCNKLLIRAIIDDNNIRYKQFPVNEDYIFMLEYLLHSHSLCTIPCPLYHWTRTVGKSTMVNSIPDDIIDIYNKSHILTFRFFNNKIISDRVLYRSYELLVDKLFKALDDGLMDSFSVFGLLDRYHKNRLVKDAYNAYTPQSILEYVVFFLQKQGFFRANYAFRKYVLRRAVKVIAMVKKLSKCIRRRRNNK